MAMNAMGAGFVVTAKDAASAVFRKVGNAFGATTKQAKTSLEKMNMGAGASLGAMGGGMVAAGNAMLRLSGTLAEGAATVDRNLGRVAGRVGGSAEALSELRGRLTGPEFADLHQDVNQITGTFARLVEETGSADEAMKQLRPSLELATAAGLENEAAGGMLSDVLAQFKLNGDAAAATADKLALTMNKAGILGTELEPMLAGTASGAALANQGLDDTLLAVGLIKGRFPAATKAAGALNMAMIQLSDPKVQQEIAAQGVTVRDQAGKIRPVVDIMGELAERTAGMTEAQRAQAMQSVFGGRAAGGLSVIMDTLAEGVKDASGETVRGAAAVAALRSEMENGTGTARTMAKAMKDNYTGAAERATKAGHRWADAWGEGAQALRRPFLEAKAAALDAFSTLLQGTDPSARRNILGVVTALGALSKVVGGLIVGMGAMKMFGISFTDLIFTFAKAILIIGPLTLLLGGLGIGMYALYRSVNRNASGVGDSWRDMVGKIKLGWKAAVELITRGDLSRATERELNKAKNKGVLSFVQGFERFLGRLRAFWDGLKKGFDEGAAALGPSTRALLERFKQITGFFMGDAANTPDVLAQWGANGASAGRQLAQMGNVALEVLNWVADAVETAAEWFGTLTADDIAGWIDTAVTSFNGLVATLDTLGTALGFVADVLGTIYHLIRVVGAIIGDIFGMDVSAAGAAWDMLAGKLTGDEQQVGRGVETIRNFKFFEATQREAGETGRFWGVRTTAGMTEEERAAYYAEESKGARKASVRELRKQQEQIAAYMQTTGAEWAAGARPMGQSTAFGALPAAQQQEWIAMFDKISSTIKDLGGRPVNLYVDREKIATAVGNSGTAQGTRELSEGDAMI